MADNKENRQRFSRTDLKNAARDGWNIALHTPETNQCVATKLEREHGEVVGGIELRVSHEVARECLAEPIADINRFHRLLDESMARDLTKAEKKFIRKMEASL